MAAVAMEFLMGKKKIHSMHVYSMSWKFLNFVLAGSEDIIVTLRWLMLMMLHYPDVQKKCQNLIDDVVEDGRTPSLKDRPELPYIDAVILETVRFSNLAPYPLPRQTLEDVEIQGYLIPKG